MRKLGGTMLLITLISLPFARNPFADVTGTAATGDKVYVLGIEGMMCEKSCVEAVKKSIESLPGVRKVEVSFEDRRAIVHTDPGVELTARQVDASFRNQGYFVSSIETERAK